MPITDIHFENGVFYCKAVGEITPDDAIFWVKHAERFAENSSYPIIAMIDASECSYITAKARTILARASATPNLYHAAIAVSDFKVRQSAQLIAMMAHDNHTHVFDTVAEAANFAYHHARMLRDHQAGV